MSRPSRTPPDRSRGFTLVEMMIVIAVLAIVAGMAIPNYLSAVESARLAACIAEVRILSREIDLYQMMNNEYPASLADIKRDQTRDPWGRPYSYLNLKDVIDDHGDDHEHIPPGQSNDGGNGNGGNGGNGGTDGGGNGNGGNGGIDGGTGGSGSGSGNGNGSGNGSGGGGGEGGEGGEGGGDKAARERNASEIPISDAPLHLEPTRHVLAGLAAPALASFAPPRNVEPSFRPERKRPFPAGHATIAAASSPPTRSLAPPALAPGPRPRKDKQLHPINSDYDLYSVGKDGETVAPLTAKKSWDDVIRAADGAYIGLAKGF